MWPYRREGKFIEENIDGERDGISKTKKEKEVVTKNGMIEVLRKQWTGCDEERAVSSPIAPE